ncbi:MAG: Mrp/NBP35 family ATP-binding protein [Actinobacteria bacterium]|nr:Mrp/NBP35 family ATP-binding protein [Actinomycetota bacterium]
MSQDSKVLDALRTVREPRLRGSIVDLGLVKGVGGVKRGRVSVRIGSLEPTLPTRAQLTHAVTQALRDAGVADDVRVEIDELGPDEQRAVYDVMMGGTPAGARTVPFDDPGNRARVLGINSGKGGVGKSSVTVNIAIALARRGHQVAILDADVYGFSIPKMLGIEEDPISLEDIMIPPVRHGVAVISTGFFVGDEQAVIWRGPMLHKALQQFLVDVWWGDLDYLLVDMPPGTGDVALSMSQYVPRSEVYIVTTPQAAAQRVAQRTAAMAAKVNLPVRGVIENMSWFTGDDGKRYEIFGRGGGAELAERIGVPLLGQVPLVPALREGGDIGLPITVAEPDSEAAQAFVTLADAVHALGPKRIYKSALKIN